MKTALTTTPDTHKALKCLIRGHDHALNVVDRLQSEDGATASMLECPTGRYRWFLLDTVSWSPNALRFNRPRHGWRES